MLPIYKLSKKESRFVVDVVTTMVDGFFNVYDGSTKELAETLTKESAIACMRLVGATEYLDCTQENAPIARIS